MKYSAIIALLSFILSVNAYGQTSNDIDSLVKVSRTQTDSVQLATFLKIGQLYNRVGLEDSAEIYFNFLLKKAKALKNETQICLGYLSLGGVNIHKGNFNEALDNFFKALEIANKRKWKKYIADADIGVGYIYMEQKREKDALRFFSNAKEELLTDKKIDTMYLVSVYAHLVDCVGTMGDTSAALGYYEKGSGLCNAYERMISGNRSKSEYLIARWLSLIYNTSNFLTKREDLAIALEKVMSMWEKAKDGNNDFQKFKMLNIISDFSLKLKKYNDALQHAEMALKVFQDEDHGNDYKDIHWTIAESAAALQQYEKAYKSLSIVKQYNDSLYNSIKLEEINSIEAKYKTEKKEQEIIALNKEKKNQRIITLLLISGFIVVLGLLFFAVSTSRLRRKLLVKEKERERTEFEQKMAELEQTALRAQMNPHFIFNCLNSVQRYVINKDVEGVNHYLSTFASLIRQTLENSGKQLVPLESEIKYLDTYLRMEQMRSNDQFSYNVTVEPAAAATGIEIPGMIIQPFIENSIQHGVGNVKENKGHIDLVISKNEKLLVTIADNGPGINSYKAPRSTEHQSMGKAITEKRIEAYNKLYHENIQLRINDRSEQGSGETGTIVQLAFPLINES